MSSQPNHQMIYTPSEWGKIYHSLDTTEALGAGAAGPGKSMVLLFDPMEQISLEHNRCMLKRGQNGFQEWGMSSGHALHLRRTMPQLDETLKRAAKFFPRIDPDVTFNKERHMYTFKSGYRYQFAHCKDEGDWGNFQSNEYSHLAFDELTQFTEEQYHQIMNRIRSSDQFLRNMLKVRSMSNPFAQRDGTFKVKDPHWVRRRFIDPHPQGKVVIRKVLKRSGPEGETFERTRIYLPATLYDNPDPDFVRNYEEQLLDKPFHIRQTMLYGNWYVNPGSFFGEDWNQAQHVCRPFKVPSSWRVFRSMDWGYKHPGCVGWWALDEDDNLFCIREFTFQKMDATRVARRMKEIEKTMGFWGKGGSLLTGPADTQLWEERGSSAMSKAEEFLQVGIGWMRADKTSRAMNAQRVLARMKGADDYSSSPGIKFFEDCEKCIMTIPAIQTNQHWPEEPEEGGDDHWYDMVAYACAYASSGRVGTSRDAARGRGREKEEDDEDPVVTIRGRFGYGNRIL